ncbi:MAG: hypothetical protein R2867_20845 [Caldilineaceae bacterium]
MQARNPVDPDQPLPRNPLTGAPAVTLDQRGVAGRPTCRYPALTLLDSLGRAVISVADTGSETHVTVTHLDAEGKLLWIRDARNNLVMQYITPAVPNDQLNDPTADFAPVTTSQATCSFSTAWTPATVGCSTMLRQTTRGMGRSGPSVVEHL